jgi:hypothetical protein
MNNESLVNEGDKVTFHPAHKNRYLDLDTEADWAVKHRYGTTDYLKIEGPRLIDGQLVTRHVWRYEVETAGDRFLRWGQVALP